MAEQASEPCRPVDLREDGLLWLINRTTFHPRGFALAVNPDGSFCLYGDGSQPWRFVGPPQFEDDLFQAVERLLRPGAPTN